LAEEPASIVTAEPEQMEGFGGEKTITGNGFTVTVTVRVAGQFPDVETVYVPVTVGEIVTLGPVAL
jgi:hypothetical protein